MSDRLLIRKDGRARYISHLDIMRTMQRAFVRAGVAIKHTEGFNPHPYISFALPLPLGTGSDCELMDFELRGGTALEDVPGLLNPKLPEGITVLKAYRSDRKFKQICWLQVQIGLEYDNGISDNDYDRLRALYDSDPLVVDKRSKRGVSAVDIRPLYRKPEWLRVSANELRIVARLAAQEPSLSPATFVSAIAQRLPELAPDFASIRRLEVFDRDDKVFR